MFITSYFIDIFKFHYVLLGYLLNTMHIVYALFKILQDITETKIQNTDSRE